MRHNAFTMVEILCVMAIIGAISAISLPVVARARESASVTRCISNMRQIHQAMEIYRQDWGSMEIGTADQMGFPPHSHALVPLGITQDMKKCHRPVRQGMPASVYTWLVGIGERFELAKPSWEEYVDQLGPRTVVIADGNHNDSHPLNSPYFADFGFGVNLAGGLERAHGLGFPGSRAWWVKNLR